MRHIPSSILSCVALHAASAAVGLATAPPAAAADQNVARLVGGCGPGTAGRSGAAMPIPGDPQGRKGWRDDAEMDDAGNRYEVWCIEIAGGVGNSFGQRYIPNGGNPVWIGRCAFIAGRNVDTKESTGDANKNGNPDAWKKLKWTSRDPADGKDYDWEYVTATNNLKRWETLNGMRLRPATPDYDGAASANFDNLLAVVPANPVNDMLRQAVVAVALLTHTGSEWTYGLTGWTLDPFSPTVVRPGDSWAMVAEGVFGALAPIGWTVDFSSNYVNWTYGGAEFTLTALSGFGIQSGFAGGGDANWIAISADGDRANFGYAGLVAGPVPLLVSEPAPWLLVGIALAAAGVRRRRPTAAA